MEYVTFPKKIPEGVAKSIARFVRLIAECNVTQGAACDEAARVLFAAGNDHEALIFETAAEQHREAARLNFRTAFALRIPTGGIVNE